MPSNGATALQQSPPAPWIAGLKEKCRGAVAGGLYYSGLLGAVRQMERSYAVVSNGGLRRVRLRLFPDSKFGILCYHRVGTEGVPVFSRLEPHVFEAQMRYLKRNYRLVSLAQLCMELREERAVPPTLAITFDDGYRDLYQHAFPVLRTYAIPATIYLIGKSMETGEVAWYDRVFVALKNAPETTLDVELDTQRSLALTSSSARASAAWEIVCYLRTMPDAKRREWCAQFEKKVPVDEAELSGRILTWQQVHEMQNYGVSFGAHTMSHPSVGQLGAASLEEELGESKRLLENGLGAPVEDFSYPFGKANDCGAEAEPFLAKAGYRSAVTTLEGVNSFGANLLYLRRLQINDSPSISSFAFGISRMFLEGVTPSVGGLPQEPRKFGVAVSTSSSRSVL